MQAAFIDIGSSRNGFLQINDIHPTYFLKKNKNNKSSKSRHRNFPNIQDVLEPEQELVVQVVKDERDAKGATLTTNLSIPGRFLVLMIGSQKGGVSRKISDEAQRKKLKSSISNLVVPPGMSVIVRTAGIDKSSEELQKDLDALVEQWKKILKDSFKKENPTLLYEEGDLLTRAIRDYLRDSFDEILVDKKETFEKVHLSLIHI